MAISDKAEDVLITHSLGSCLGVCFYDTALKIGGMIHIMLPLSSTDPRKAQSNPCMFVDTGVGHLLQAMFNRGCTKQNLLTKVAGGARVMSQSDIFRIGERNYTVLRKILWKNSMLIHGEDVGGNCSRTIQLPIATGLLQIRSHDEVKEL